ncbi:MAG: hypothetical protein V4714_21545 [Bacteroidota bacterium]
MYHLHEDRSRLPASHLRGDEKRPANRFKAAPKMDGKYAGLVSLSKNGTDEVDYLTVDKL